MCLAATLTSCNGGTSALAADRGRGQRRRAEHDRRHDDRTGTAGWDGIGGMSNGTAVINMSGNSKINILEARPTGRSWSAPIKWGGNTIASATINMTDNAQIISSVGWLAGHIWHDTAGNQSSTFTATLNKNSLLDLGYLWLADGPYSASDEGYAQYAVGTITVNDTATLRLDGGMNAGSLGGLGTITLNGGTMQVMSNSVGNTNFEENCTLYINGGTVKAGGPFSLTGTARARFYIQSGGATFDTNGSDILLPNKGLLEDPASTGGGLTKKGLGNLTLTQLCTYTGATTVQGGQLTFGSDGAGNYFDLPACRPCRTKSRCGRVPALPPMFFMSLRRGSMPI